ncbi:UNKNOWN [Stylonychia lemnae]|uniref:Cilia- and flagella-associated protein 36 n=1 Tax=Stylonychia lemnae TaxID=5949 RepID=A0A078AM96_STYLE|nr:UNKNOWN [Stylonychia lemnae]|eukprot:CDW81963.1 UNKNOWN [Stylonychia lemnae]
MARFLQSQYFLVPIKSFIEEFCIIFAIFDEDEEQAYKEKRQIFREYKNLINKLIIAFLKKYNVQRDILNDIMSGIYSSDLTEEVVQYLYAVEDFDVFTLFMSETNQMLDSQTEDQLSLQKYNSAPVSQVKRQKSQGATAIDTMNEDIQKILKQTKMQQQEEDLYDIALKESMEESEKRLQHKLAMEEQEELLLKKMLELSEKEENDRKRKQQQEEDDVLKFVLEESIKMEEERQKFERSKTMQEELMYKLIEEQKEVQKMQEQLEKERKEKEDKKIAELRQRQMFAKVQPLQEISIKKAPVEKIIEPEIVETTAQQQEEEKQQIDKESIEERQRRLKIQRDILRREKEEKGKKDHQIQEQTLNRGKTPMDKQRMNRCLNVLQEAADQMFKGKRQEDILDIDYYKKNGQDQNNDNDNEDDDGVILLGKGKRRNIGKASKQVINLDWKDEDFD